MNNENAARFGPPIREHRFRQETNTMLTQNRMATRPLGIIVVQANIVPIAATIAAITCCTQFALAQPARDDQPATTLTIYSSAQPGGIPPELYSPEMRQQYGVQLPGYAIVKQERPIELEKGRSVIRFTDVAAKIDPTTVRFESLTDPDGTRVLEQNYEFDLVSTEKLMERFLDTVITVEQAHGNNLERFTGKLLSTAGGIVLQADDGSVKVINGYSNVQFPELPGGLITRPTLVWLVSAESAGQQKTRVSYETKAMTWWADYNVVFADGADANSAKLDVGAWVSIINQSGASYADSRLKLIAGDVHRAPQPQPVYSKAMRRQMDMAAAAPEAGFEEKAFFEYHLYTLGRTTTLPDNSTKQIELFPQALAIPAEKILLYFGLPVDYPIYGSPMTDRDFGVASNTKIDIYLRFKNEKQVGMGIPLPAGRIRVSKLDTADGSLEFIGEDTIDHTPRDEEVLIKMGSAFDVVGERKQIDFKVDTNRKMMEETIEVEIRNRKEEPVKVVVKEVMYRWATWTITQKTHDFTKEDARTVHFPLNVEPGGEVKLQYTVRYTW